MSDKYVIRNCPAIYGIFLDGCKKDHYEDGTVLCKDCTDCVMKKIVDLCKKELNSLEEYVDVRSNECIILQNILKLLDIQEVE